MATHLGAGLCCRSLKIRGEEMAYGARRRRRRGGGLGEAGPIAIGCGGVRRAEWRFLGGQRAQYTHRRKQGED